MEIQNVLQLIWPIIVIQISFQIYALIDLIVVKKQKTKRLPFIAWLLIILMGQIIGSALYFILGRSEE